MSASVSCRVFAGSQGKGLYLLWLVIVSGTGLGIAIGLPAPLVVVLMIGGAMFAIRKLAGTATYTVSNEGVTREFVSFAGKPAPSEIRRWSEIVTWKHEHTVSRGFERYEYIEVDAQRGPRWVITSRQAAAEFAEFRDEFLQVIGQIEAGTFSEPHTMSPAPRRRPSFYRTWYGRLTSLTLAGAALWLSYAALVGLVALNGIIKLGILIVPGSLYLLWRSFGPRNT